MELFLFGLSLSILQETLAAIEFNQPPSNTSVLEGGTATFTCRPEVNGSLIPGILLSIRPLNGLSVTISLLNNTNLTGASGVFRSPDRTQVFITGVQSSLHQASLECTGRSGIDVLEAPVVYLSVQRAPNFTLPLPFKESREGENLTIVLENVDFGNIEGNVSVMFQDSVLTQGNSFNVAGPGSDNISRITFPIVYRNNTGVYRVVLSNVHGSVSANFTLNVLYPPEFTGVASDRSVQLRNGSTFSFNCTPSDANPSTVSYSFRRNGTNLSVSGSVLTISSVVRGDSGNYSCTATNSAGSTILYYGLLAVAPPTEPQTMTVSQVTPFSSTISWTLPTDDGGVSSASWTPPPLPFSTGLTYHVIYSNSSGSWTSTVNSTRSMLAYLQHSTNYTVSVVAENVYGNSTPSGEVMFRTSDSKPIIDRISLTALSLTNFTVNITFLTVGGQTVTSFKIIIDGAWIADNTPVSDGKLSLKTVSLVVDGLSLTKGTDYNVSVTATNSIGESESVMGTLPVPNPPSITAPPNELPPNSSSPCCSGVKLNLARPQDVSDVRVSLSVNGGPSEMVRSGDLSFSGDILYISGLQAGIDYTANITVSNIFGSTERQTMLRPQLGRPSNPAVPVVTVEGTVVTVLLSTAYPGTERTRDGSMFTFQVKFFKDDCSCQSILEIVNVTSSNLNGTVATYRGVLKPGSYTVSVTAVNEHGNSTSVMSEQFSVQAHCTSETQSGADSVTLVLVIIIVVLFILLVVLAVYSMVVTVKLRKGALSKQNVGSYKLEPVYDEMGMEPRPSKNEVTIDKNPAYDSADVGKPSTAAAVEYEEVGGGRENTPGIKADK